MMYGPKRSTLRTLGPAPGQAFAYFDDVVEAMKAKDPGAVVLYTGVRSSRCGVGNGTPHGFLEDVVNMAAGDAEGLWLCW